MRKHPDDVVLLAEKLLAFYGRNNHRTFSGFRELSNVIERAAILCRADRVGIECLPTNLLPNKSLPNIGESVTLEKIEEQHIRRILATTKSLQEAADILGMIRPLSGVVVKNTGFKKT